MPYGIPLVFAVARLAVLPANAVRSRVVAGVQAQ